MLLALSVISQNAVALGAGSYKVFDERGGTIGRIGGNDWILPDPDKFVSSRHATIHCQGGQFFLQDTSTNGTFLNGPDQPVGRDQPLGLSDGDRLFIGEYEILVQLIEDAASPEPEMASEAEMVEPRPAFEPEPAPAMAAMAVRHPFEAAPGEVFDAQPYQQASGNPAFEQIGVPADPMLGPLEDDGLAAFAPAQEDPFQQQVRTPAPQPMARPQPAARAPAPGGHGGQIPTDYQITGFRTPGPAPAPMQMHPAPESIDPLAGLPAQRPGRVAPPASRPPPAAPAPPYGKHPAAPRAAAPAPSYAPPPPPAPPVADQAGGAELLSTMGLDPSHVDPVVYEQLGTIVRLVVQGLIDVLQSRAEIKNNFRMPMTSIRPVENNPLKFSMNADDALHNLFVKRNPGYLAPVESFQEAFQDVAFHQLAMLAGVRAAYDAMLAKLHPDRLEEIYERKLKRTALLNVGKQSKFWDLYREQFEDIDRDAEAHFQLLFGEEFAKAYNEQLQRLNAAARARHR
jgi:type VI secretion system protein